uniref:Uncharacterized protein n=1 Tax=Panagrolaimus sp. PS1159 TaxID=55785 RepID=A0AC35F664_9BILA
MSSTTVSTGIQTESMPPSVAAESHSVNESSFTKNETEEEMPEEEIEFVSTGIQTESIPSVAAESHSVKESSLTKNEIEEQEMPEEEIEFGCPHNVYEKITNIRSNATH